MHHGAFGMQPGNDSACDSSHSKHLAPPSGIAQRLPFQHTAKEIAKQPCREKCNGKMNKLRVKIRHFGFSFTSATGPDLYGSVSAGQIAKAR
ncbi:MAG: hypothetical protein QF662_02745, partial [Phycisphaerae bacterium]|nr:hypothetical protein [Phycisphaerae bacterium]